MTSPPLDEFGLIARYFAPLATDPAAAGLTDDVAVLAGRQVADGLVLTMDGIVGGVHFLLTDRAAEVAERALRANLSDLAAKGADPIGYLITLALTPETDEAWVADFAAGLAANQAAFGWSLLGGDTVKTPGPLSVSVTAIGRAARTGAPRRGGAGAGDRLWVTGVIGDGALGLAAAQGQGPAIDEDLLAAAEAKFRLPEPRIGFGRAAVEAGLMTASADISDGLLADAGHIAESSHLRARIRADAVPFSPGGRAAVAADPAWLGRLLAGGDDYELVFTAAPEAEAAIRAVAEQTGVAATPIGWMEEGQGVVVEDSDGEPIAMRRAGFQHFQS